MTEAEQKARELKRKQVDAHKAAAYRDVFGSDKGQAVLRDLIETFRLEKAVFTPIKTGENVSAYDPLTAALTDGGRRVVIHIQEMLRKPHVEEKPKKKVTR